MRAAADNINTQIKMNDLNRSLKELRNKIGTKKERNEVVPIIEPIIM